VKGFYTTHEAARLLGVSLPTVVNWIRERRLPCHRTPGGHRRIAPQALAAFMLRQGMALPAELQEAAPRVRTALVIGPAGPEREGATVAVARAGWAAEQASPGFPAGAALARLGPDVVVVLASDPAAAPLAELRSDRESAGLPVVVLGHAAWADRLRAAGASTVLSRPLDPGALAEALSTAAAPALEPPAPRRGRARARPR